MCPVRFVTYVSGRSIQNCERHFPPIYVRNSSERFEQIALYPIIRDLAVGNLARCAGGAEKVSAWRLDEVLASVLDRRQERTERRREHIAVEQARRGS